jgi:CRISPR type I-E-associated protein CasB/Cse2
MINKVDASRLVAWLTEQCRAVDGRYGGAAASQAKAVLARLRRGTGKRPGAASDAYRYVVPFIPDESADDEDGVEALFLVATLFACHRLPGPRGNLGATFRALDDPSGSNERRFVALLNSGWPQVQHHVRQVVRMAAAKEVVIDFELLAADMLDWQHASTREKVRLDWAQAFWGGRAAALSTNAPAGEQEN